MDRIQLRRDTSANWAKVNPILLEGEVGFETDTKLRKIGDGVNRWNDLEYLRAEGISQELGDSENATISQKTLSLHINKLTPIIIQEDEYDKLVEENKLDINKIYYTYE